MPDDELDNQDGKPEKEIQADSQSNQKTEVKDDEDPAFKEWKSLEGKSQERFRKIIQEKNELNQQLEEWKQRAAQRAENDQQQVTTTQTSTYAPQDDEVDRAMKTLVDRGVATREEVKQYVQEALNQVNTNTVDENLSRKYDGSDGLPAYDKSEVDDFIRRSEKNGRPIYDREAAFRQMYWDEFMDYAAKRKKKGEVRETTLSSERPTIKINNEVMDMETFRKKLQDPKYHKKLASNPELFDKITSQLLSQ